MLIIGDSNLHLQMHATRPGILVLSLENELAGGKIMHQMTYENVVQLMGGLAQFVEQNAPVQTAEPPKTRAKTPAKKRVRRTTPAKK